MSISRDDGPTVFAHVKRQAEEDWDKEDGDDQAANSLYLRVDTWTPDGESIVEHVAGVEDYQVALATYPAACERWPGTPFTLRQGARDRGQPAPLAKPALHRAGRHDFSKC